MKQPELGKRILHLRESKGLTQEELVTKCNLNVRTIQRIEAGEVTPRSYTIRTIFDALEVDPNEFRDTINLGSEGKKSILNYLLFSIIGGIIYFIVGFPEVYMDYLRVMMFMDHDVNEYINPALYIIVKILSAGSAGLLMWGFWQTAKVYKHKPLQYSTIAFFGTVLVIAIIDSLSLTFPAIDSIELGIAETLIFALATAFFGASLIMVRNDFGNLALIAGLLELMVATTMISMIFIVFSLFLMIPALFLELILLYQIREKLKNESSLSSE